MGCTAIVVGLAAGLALLSGPMARAGEVARAVASGVVFEDANANGLRDAGEAGIAGVGVSDGGVIVETDAQGRWSIPIEGDATLFVIQPRGWRVPTDGQGTRRFWYSHKPGGSPALEHAGLAPTGPLPASIDFALVRVQEPQRVRVAVLGDPQPRDAGEIGHLQRDVVQSLLGEEQDMVLALGDIMFDDLSLYDEYSRMMGALGVPVVNVHGNHDLNFDVETDELSDETWERLFGPATYSFDFGPAHFVLIDNVVYEGASKDRGYHAAVGARNMAFLRADLARVEPGTPIVVALHIPVEELRDREEFLGVLGEHGAMLSLTSHWHMQKHAFFGAEQGWTGPGRHRSLVAGAACGSWFTGATDAYGIPHSMMRCGTPTGWTVLELDRSLPDGYRLSFRAARRPPEMAMHLHAPVAVAPGGEAEVAANVWFAAPDDRVEVRVVGGAWSAMVRERRIDPFFEQIKAMEESPTPPNGRKLPGLVPSEHLWVARVPVGAGEGARVVEVRWRDAWGRESIGRTIVRVEP